LLEVLLLYPSTVCQHLDDAMSKPLHSQGKKLWKRWHNSK